MMKPFTIGQAAKAADVNVETVRFYERKGLITQPLKPENGAMREYDDETVSQIRFIRQAQEIGFSLREISELLSLRADPGADCSDVRSRAIEKRADVEAKLGKLMRMRTALDGMIASCPGAGNVECCTILDAMQEEPPPSGSEQMTSETPSEKAPDEMKTTLFTINGMHCDGCAHTIEALLSRVDGVRKVEISFENRRARVLHDQTSATTDELITVISKGGFTAKPDEK
ncbi:MerR family DNA-binding protein [Henriciella sp.]|uniref:MerR family DNA-binding protein n=1 Tax=Henriciella sp. TaxID=1968823 RepID=UPI002619EAAD|nr:MerR family DNA-binding protein [Henriciella sp.]